MKKITTLSAALLLTLTVLSPASACDKSPVVTAIKKAKPSVVLIQCQKQGNWGTYKPVLGAGVVLDDSGIIVTSGHVVSRGENITVTLPSGLELPARVVAGDPDNDLALLRVKADKGLLIAAKLNTATPEVGQSVIALGHPYGHLYSASLGIVSALGRDIPVEWGQLTDTIQTDAAINPGNSGGPLLNTDGEVVGIVAALRDGAHGIGFVIRAEAVVKLLAHYRKESK